MAFLGKFWPKKITSRDGGFLLNVVLIETMGVRGGKVKQAFIGFGKWGPLEKGSFQKGPFSRDSRESRDFRDSREPPDCGKQRRIRPSSRDSREFRDFGDLEIPRMKRPLS